VRRRQGPFFLYLGFALLVGLHFYARPRLFEHRAAPDFLLLALMLVAMRARPGVAAVTGFIVGLVNDVLTPANFGAGALAHTVVGYLASWGRAVFFPNNLLVNAGLIALGVMVRNALVLLASTTQASELARTLAIWSPLQALGTGLAGIIVLLLFRNWFAIRIEA
jgi:rod shape-determining protein MreD